MDRHDLGSVCKLWFRSNLNFAREAMRRIQRRSFNQAVNFSIQGLCAALAKQTILRLVQRMKDEGLSSRFMLLIHDEILVSAKREEAAKTCDIIYEEMIKDTPMLPNVSLDSSVAIGYTFQPFDPVKAPYGQIELMELQKGVPYISVDREGKKATEKERETVINYLTIDRLTKVA